VASLALGFVGLSVYFYLTILRGGVCLLLEEPGSPSGWGEISLVVAMVLGLGLWGALGAIDLWRPGRAGRRLLWFAVSYGVCLVVLGLVAPLLWGPPQCQPADIHW
jgi:hypothetical protein